MDHKAHGTRMRNLLGLRWPPVALAFRSAPPPNVRRISESLPAGCGYWRHAAEGEIFFTEASDHYNCPIGAHTHGVDLPSERSREFQEIVGTMVRIGYIELDEVAAIPRGSRAFGVAVYAPLTATPTEPDVVLVRGNALQMMLLAEAVRAAGVSHDMAAMLRPTCAIIPEAIQSGRPSLSLGCIGNRVYTDLGPDEMYFALPAQTVADVVDKLDGVVKANRELESFHHQRGGET